MSSQCQKVAQFTELTLCLRVLSVAFSHLLGFYLSFMHSLYNTISTIAHTAAQQTLLWSGFIQDSTGLRASLSNQTAKPVNMPHPAKPYCGTVTHIWILAAKHTHIHPQVCTGRMIMQILNSVHLHKHTLLMQLHLSSTAAHSHRFSRTSHCSEAQTLQPLPASHTKNTLQHALTFVTVMQRSVRKNLLLFLKR